MKQTNSCRVDRPRAFRLRDCAPGDELDLRSRARAEARAARDIAALPELQQRLYAEGRQALLIILQAMDAGGKDGTIRRVMSVLNPQGCRVTSFKAPTPEDLAHDFLWRVHTAAPRRGEIMIFNRSHYEDVLIVRVRGLVPKAVWSARYAQINAFEELLASQGVRILKFFLHIGRAEQKRRLQERLDDPSKHWKVNPADVEERRRWDDYQDAYEEAIRRCSTPVAPWYVVPADHKWVRNAVIARVVRETLEDMNPRYPEPACDVGKIRIPD